MSVKCLIVDDESVAHDIIRKYCALLPNLQVMRDCYDAIEAIEYLSVNPIDLIFLDLNMPKLRGFEFLKTLPNPPKVIVTTAYKEYALEGYELNVVDYLLKPFSFERFVKAVNKACLKPSKPVPIPIEEVPETKPGRIFVRTNSKHVQIELDEILFVEASGNYVKIVLKEEVITIRGNLSSLTEHIPTEGLVQVHRSFMVSQKHIKSIEGNQINIDKYTVPISKSFRAQLDQLLK
ncbi:LytTR family DNA-binding domain-containing protein [Algoriphagus sp. AGSA1]|uniref:LytR/AlgR family response regulator transcription factor n=1 Tax=Algoriphagus sp. AGSA1 TaxID=2907213 RepID=UPI001F1B72FD|nr:LytTR family DNA-binding domain-containing protein [Algoriphagus sp. AGSA1]MCE7054291.1 LytTR family DNA-binding domain-containing protein [Algoriphagus sp. AGSA1]